jgi:hypothetical protein
MQNVVLLVINAVGVWRYLLSPHRKEKDGAGDEQKGRAPQRNPVAAESEG